MTPDWRRLHPPLIIVGLVCMVWVAVTALNHVMTALDFIRLAKVAAPVAAQLLLPPLVLAVVACTSAFMALREARGSRTAVLVGWILLGGVVAPLLWWASRFVL